MRETPYQKVCLAGHQQNESFTPYIILQTIELPSNIFTKVNRKGNKNSLTDFCCLDFVYCLIVYS